MSNPKVTDIADGASATRLILRITPLDANGDQSTGPTTEQVVVEGIEGSPEGRAVGSLGDMRIRRDVPQLWQKISGVRTTTGWQLVTGGGGGGLCDAVPQPIVPGAVGSPGIAGDASRCDHEHPASAADTWAEALAAGQPSGGLNPILTDGDVFQGEDINQPLSAGVLALRAGNNAIGPGGNAVMTGGTGGTIGGNSILQAGSSGTQGGDAQALAFDDGSFAVRTQTTGFEETLAQHKTFGRNIAAPPLGTADVNVLGSIGINGQNLKIRCEVTFRLSADNAEVSSSVLWQTFYRSGGTVLALTSHLATPDFQSAGLIAAALTFTLVISGDDIILRAVNASGDEFIDGPVSVRWTRQLGGIEA